MSQRQRPGDLNRDLDNIEERIARIERFIPDVYGGVIGPAGPQGVQGPSGATGAAGPAGPQGTTGGATRGYAFFMGGG